MCIRDRYNGAGKWIVDVGVPAKSGVSGVVLGVVPDVCGFAVFSPKLDMHGNSTRGVLVAKALSETLGLHVLKGSKKSGMSRESSVKGGSLNVNRSGSSFSKQSSDNKVTPVAWDETTVVPV